MTALAQSSASSTKVVEVEGKRYVLVPAEVFPLVEKAVEELPAVRELNKALTEDVQKADQQIALSNQVIELQRRTLEATERALQASETARQAEARRADSEAQAREALSKALAVSEAETERLRGKVASANKRTVIATVGAIIAFALKFL